MERIDYSLKIPGDFDNAAGYLDGYLIEVEKVEKNHDIKASAKLRATVLEELSVYLFSKSSVVAMDNLELFNKKIYAGITVEHDLSYKVLHKDVDFCIGKTSKLSINGAESEVRFPFVCVEAKTYVDATMNHEILFSGTQLKTASPDVQTYVLMEYESAIAEDSPIPASYSYAIDRYFNLRECKRPKKGMVRTPIRGSLIMEYYAHVIDNFLR